MNPDIDNFLKKYALVLKEDPLYGGYLAHLHLDRSFWQNYIKASVEFRDADGRQTESVKDLKTVWLKKNDEVILPEDFFSKDYLYGDYTRLNKLLIRKYQLVIPGYHMEQSHKIKEADGEKMKNVLEHLEGYIKNSPVCTAESDLRVLSMQTLETFLRETAQQFVELYRAYTAFNYAVPSYHLKYQTTGTMLNSQDYRKIDLSSMKPGDIFLKSGHVMMYVGRSEGGYAVFEADANDSKCSYNVYSYRTIKGYGCYRLKGFKD